MRVFFQVYTSTGELDVFEDQHGTGYRIASIRPGQDKVNELAAVLVENDVNFCVDYGELDSDWISCIKEAITEADVIKKNLIVKNAQDREERVVDVMMDNLNLSVRDVAKKILEVA